LSAMFSPFLTPLPRRGPRRGIPHSKTFSLYS